MPVANADKSQLIKGAGGKIVLGDTGHDVCSSSCGVHVTAAETTPSSMPTEHLSHTLLLFKRNNTDRHLADIMLSWSGPSSCRY